MGPLTFHPVLKRTRWGGRRLGTMLGKPLPDGADYAESWEICDHGIDQSVVDRGTWAGKTLHELVRDFPHELLGQHSQRTQFPLLLKFLDAHDRISVQVHPDDNQVAQLDTDEMGLHQNGKSEAWVILAAEPESQLFVGLKQHVDRPMLESKLAASELEDCLHRLSVQAGDVVFVPAGTVHAIGEGILLAEVQQTSDITYRLSDWGRLDQQGRPRPLHLKQAMKCIDFDRGPIEPQRPETVLSKTLTADDAIQVEQIVACEHFVIHRYLSRDPFHVRLDDRFHILMVLDGNGHLRQDNETSPITNPVPADVRCIGSSRANGIEVFPLSIGQTILLPASCPPLSIQPDGNLTLLDVFVP
ncbi:MAG: type I phosphomannose isomerase catalytic subunit [Planctomycetaceae bacterium]